MEAGHHRAGLLDHQGRSRAGAGLAALARLAGLGRAGRQVLVGVRGPRQGRDHRAATARAPCRAGRARPAGAPRASCTISTPWPPCSPTQRAGLAAGAAAAATTRSPWGCTRTSSCAASTATAARSAACSPRTSPGPMDLSFYIGLPDRVDTDRVAVLGRLGAAHLVRQLPGVPWALAAQVLNRRSATAGSLNNPRLGAPERFTGARCWRRRSPRPTAWGTRARWPGSTARPRRRTRGSRSDADTLAELAEPVAQRGVRTDVLLRARRDVRARLQPPGAGLPRSAQPDGCGRTARPGSAGRSPSPTPPPGWATPTSPTAWASGSTTTRARTALRRAVYACLA